MNDNYLREIKRKHPLAVDWEAWIQLEITQWPFVFAAVVSVILVSIMASFFGYVLWSKQQKSCNTHLLLHFSATAILNTSAVLLSTVLLYIAVDGSLDTTETQWAVHLPVHLHEIGIIMSLVTGAVFFVEEFWFICRAIHYCQR